MRVGRYGQPRLAVGLLLVVALVGGVLFAGTAQAVKSAARGFDGTTVKIAGIGIGTNFGKADVGTQARVKRFNDDNEIKGVKISYVGFTDDKQEPATSLSEVRRLVTQEQVFALVPDLSSTIHHRHKTIGSLKAQSCAGRGRRGQALIGAQSRPAPR